jgi:uncharacterized protein YndB with AHSA1/START domain
MSKPQFVYVTYIRATPERIWDAVAKPEFTRQCWGAHVNVSDWKPGSGWEHIAENDNNEVRVVGKVVECTPPKRLVLTWADPANKADDSRVTIEIEPMKDLTRLSVVHGDFKPGTLLDAKISIGWPLVLSSIKSFLETGEGIDIWSLKATTCGGESAN